ncbi:hypothetical protein VTJ83DRAFT_6623 [Remersonia thermophila]|uniref:Uncharacterized protein n=1 Tax=Remersonia thermophila TaxID=72144 RepID=A0ABR4D594_9PEZI
MSTGPGHSGLQHGYHASPATRSQFSMSRFSSAYASSSLADDDSITPHMRHRQARGKDPYDEDDVLGDGNLAERSTLLRLGSGRAEKEDFYMAETRQQAIAFLDNPELLEMHALSTGLSITAARLHFMKQLCGYNEDERPGNGPALPSSPQSRRAREAASKRQGPRFASDPSGEV